MIYKNIAQGDVFDLKSFILGTLDFTGSNYSWYIEMYIGLFLLAPFLNLAYGKLKNKKQKQVLLVTAVFLTIIPSLFNIFNFGSLDWWTNPTSSDEFQKLVPSWWQDSTRCILLCGLLHKRIRIENENKNNACTLCFFTFHIQHI